MRGSPPVQLALLLLGFLVVGAPLIQLTHGRVKIPVGAPTSPTAVKRPVFVRIRYVNKPEKLLVRSGSQDLLANASNSQSAVEGRTELLFVPEGLELWISAEWPAGTPESVLTIELEPDGLDGRSQFLWSIDNTIDDTVSFNWKP